MTLQNRDSTTFDRDDVFIAPDVEFYAYTVCTQSCPGAAQIAALEAAMDTKCSLVTRLVCCLQK